MNLLAHAFLSFGDPDILLGNMISDFVKGKKQFDYPVRIQKGIQLHRAIDRFTDEHPSTQSIKEFFRPAYRLYSGAFTDVVYDHFLANDPTYFSAGPALQAFTEETYSLLEGLSEWHGPRFGPMFPYMKTQDWLFNYRFDWGIERSFQGLQRRSLYITESHTAFEIFLTNKDMMRACYEAFFPSVKSFAARTMVQLSAG